MADSIREKGQLAPIHVRWDAELEKWVIICGERRWRATKRAGLPTIDCRFQEDGFSPSQILEQQLIENLLCEDLKPVEQARAFASLMELNGWNGKQVAEALRVPRSTVSRALALLRLPEDLQQQVDEGSLAARSAYELSKLPDGSRQAVLATESGAGRISHQDAANAVRQRKAGRAHARRSTRLTFQTENGVRVTLSAPRKRTYHDVEQALREALEEVRLRIKNNVQML